MTTAEWPGLTSGDVLWCIQRLPKVVVDILKKHAGSLTLAGGFIRSCIANEKVNDVDLFASSPEQALAVAQKLAGDRDYHSSENAYTVTIGRGVTIQVIHRWTFERPEMVVPSFDFTIARAAIWYELAAEGEGRWRSLCDPCFYQDLAGKRLVYRSPIRNEDAGGSMLRVLKFYQRGYRVPLPSLASVIARLVHAVDMSKLDGSESSLATVLTGLLREVDPSIDPEHLAHLPGAPAVEAGGSELVS